MGKGKRRKSRVPFYEWSSCTMGHYNTGGIICHKCNFSRSLMRNETRGVYHHDNRLDRKPNCPNCGGNDWYWLPPIARVPRDKASKRAWDKFWEDLKNRKFNNAGR